MCILEVAPNSGSETALERDLLDRALKYIAHTPIEVIPLIQEVIRTYVQLVASGRGRTTAGRQVRIERALHAPSLPPVLDLGTEGVLDAFVSSGLYDPGIDFAAESLPEFLRRWGKRYLSQIVPSSLSRLYPP